MGGGVSSRLLQYPPPFNREHPIPFSLSGPWGRSPGPGCALGDPGDRAASAGAAKIQRRQNVRTVGATPSSVTV